MEPSGCHQGSETTPSQLTADKPQAFAECQLVVLKSLIQGKKITEQRAELSYDRGLDRPIHFFSSLDSVSIYQL